MMNSHDEWRASRRGTKYGGGGERFLYMSLTLQQTGGRLESLSLLSAVGRSDNQVCGTEMFVVVLLR